ncbi:MAG TPA: peptidoglycan DD-metalloendopeptidase family protein [Gammaproteobacteria bacterium]|nr:peptidoglycan DD-metalloendopeptidase family protein [Gammaproteobacteria bacterium]
MMRHRILPHVFLLVALLATACGPGAVRWEPDLHVVRQGETLYSIAWRYGLDYRALAEWNDIGRDYRIYPGQKLVLVPPAVVPAPGGGRTAGSAASGAGQGGNASIPSAVPPREVTWDWPANGPLLTDFNHASATGKGIDIGGQVGAEVRAAASGKVVYSGSGLIGYGKLIIIDHDGRYLSAYAHNSELYVSEGTQVQRGDRIATMGIGPGNRPMLHFEIRLDGKPVDPLKHLPRRHGADLEQR